MDVTISAGFSGRPYDLRMRVYTIENNVGGNYSRYRGDRYAYSRSGYGSYVNNAYAVNSWIGGYYGGGSYSLPFAPGDYAGKTVGLGSYDTGGVGHDGNGNLYFTSRIQMLNASVFGSADTGDVGMNGDFLPRPPQAPTVVGISNVTPTGMRFQFSGNWDGGSPITQWQYIVSSSPSFTGPGWQTAPNNGIVDRNDLTPGTTYYWKARGLNAYWVGAESAVASQSTLPATAPGMSVTPALSGSSATVTLSPPGGATGVTEYNIEYRPLGGATSATTTTTTTKTVTGLTPGTTYEWRANAEFGSYTSPWTGWTAVIQPNPNTNPGDYFDGSTAPRGDVTFSWSGTVNNSTARANGVSVDGWAYAADGSRACALQRITGGAFGAYSARLIFLEDMTTVGAWVGAGSLATAAKNADIEPSASYVGSIYVRPSRAQPMFATIIWLTAALAVAGTSVGATALCQPNAWTRLIATGTAPATATYAMIVAEDDSAAAGFVAWKSGEWVDADAAMVSLSSLFDWFSGDTADVPGFDYAWLGAANASVSARNVVPTTLDNPLADPDCPAPPAPPALPTIPSDCIDETGTWRRYPLTIPESTVRIWSSTLPTLILSTGTNAERQVRIRYWPNPTGDPVVATAGEWEAEQILTYMPPNTSLTLDGVTHRASASVAGGVTLPADELLYGTGGTPATWPELKCGIGYVVTIDVPLEAPPGNLDARVIVTQKM